MNTELWTATLPTREGLARALQNESKMAQEQYHGLYGIFLRRFLTRAPLKVPPTFVLMFSGWKRIFPIHACYNK